MFFIRDPKSEMAFPRVYTQLWYCLEDGTPTKIQNTRRIDLQSAIATWHELLTQDWERIEHQINEVLPKKVGISIDLGNLLQGLSQYFSFLSSKE